MNQIKRVSLFFRVLFQIIFCSLILLLIVPWSFFPDSLLSATTANSMGVLHGLINFSFIPKSYTCSGAHGCAILHPLSVLERILGFSVSAIREVPTIFIFYSLIQLFKCYEQGEIFSLQNVRYIKHIGYALLVGQILQPFYEGLMGVILTLHNPHGHRFAVVTFGQANVGIMLTALMVILISWIMAEGCKLREEQQLTI